MIVLNTLTAAVSTYSLAPQSITPTHMGDALGLYTFGGDLDGTEPITAEIVTGNTLIGESTKCRVEVVYFAITGEGDGELIVKGKSDEYRYSFPVRSQGVSRGVPGKGIRENYLSFGFGNLGGEGFRLDRIEIILVQSNTRRVA